MDKEQRFHSDIVRLGGRMIMLQSLVRILAFQVRGGASATGVDLRYYISRSVK